ncbi:MAG: hypothetical protein JSV25_16315 [Spirochaetota bacterium]|nr:MAG: hypothetical protein JSV25_16315 [Spirochaetota bacterium]
MKRYASIIMRARLAIIMGFDLLHFVIPYQYRWYSYIPDAPRTIVVSIDWINFLFSLFLTGNSLLLIIFHKRIKKTDTLALAFYCFLTFVWLCGVLITLIRPWSENYNMMFFTQHGGFIVVFILLAIPIFQIPAHLKKQASWHRMIKTGKIGY